MLTLDYRQYYSNSFSADVSRMQLKRATPFTKYLLLQDAHATFFGGKQWQACEKDLESIAPESRIHFVISLFYMVMTAYTLQKHFPQTYEVYRSLTRFPVFGREEEDGIYAEHPAWILARPLAEGFFSEEQLLEELGTSLPRFKADFHTFSEAYLAGLPYETLLNSCFSFQPKEQGIQELSARLQGILTAGG